jgi:hypothetical protein
MDATASERPWLIDPAYSGMSPQSAERSYRAAMKRRAEAVAVGSDPLPD